MTELNDTLAEELRAIALRLERGEKIAGRHGRTLREAADTLLISGNNTEAVRESIETAVATERERCALIAGKMFPRGSAHTYASENADRYRAQEETCVLIAAAIRRVPAADPVTSGGEGRL